MRSIFNPGWNASSARCYADTGTRLSPSLIQDCDRCLGGRFRTTPTVEFGAWTAPQPCCSIAAQRAFFEFGTGFLPPETDGQKDALKTLFPRRDWK
jgi:hypothetical protein